MEDTNAFLETVFLVFRKIRKFKALTVLAIFFFEIAFSENALVSSVMVSPTKRVFGATATARRIP